MERKEFTIMVVNQLRDRNRDHEPHLFNPLNSHPTPGCRTCGQGPGALQHNEYLVRDYKLLKESGEL